MKEKYNISQKIREVIKKVTEWFLVWGGIFIPTGFVFIVLALEKGNNLFGWGCFGMGIISLIGGFYFMHNLYKQLQLRDLENRQKEIENRVKFEELINEIKSFHKDLLKRR